MTPTPLEIADALRSTAEWIRDPESPKCSGATARDASKSKCRPTAVEAVQWCAIGRFGYEVRDPDAYWAFEQYVGRHSDAVWSAFDEACYVHNGLVRNRDARTKAFQAVARIIDSYAAEIEAALPVEQREPSHV